MSKRSFRKKAKTKDEEEEDVLQWCETCGQVKIAFEDYDFWTEKSTPVDCCACSEEVIDDEKYYDKLLRDEGKCVCSVCEEESWRTPLRSKINNKLYDYMVENGCEKAADDKHIFCKHCSKFYCDKEGCRTMKFYEAGKDFYKRESKATNHYCEGCIAKEQICLFLPFKCCDTCGQVILADYEYPYIRTEYCACSEKCGKKYCSDNYYDQLLIREGKRVCCVCKEESWTPPSRSETNNKIYEYMLEKGCDKAADDKHIYCGGCQKFYCDKDGCRKKKIYEAGKDFYSRDKRTYYYCEDCERCLPSCDVCRKGIEGKCCNDKIHDPPIYFYFCLSCCSEYNEDRNGYGHNAEDGLDPKANYECGCSDTIHVFPDCVYAFKARTRRLAEDMAGRQSKDYMTKNRKILYYEEYQLGDPRGECVSEPEGGFDGWDDNEEQDNMEDYKWCEDCDVVKIDGCCPCKDQDKYQVKAKEAGHRACFKCNKKGWTSNGKGVSRCMMRMTGEDADSFIKNGLNYFCDPCSSYLQENKTCCGCMKTINACDKSKKTCEEKSVRKGACKRCVLCDHAHNTKHLDVCYKCDKVVCDDCLGNKQELGGDIYVKLRKYDEEVGGASWKYNTEHTCYQCLPKCKTCGTKLRNIKDECCGERTDYCVNCKKCSYDCSNFACVPKHYPKIYCELPFVLKDLPAFTKKMLNFPEGYAPAFICKRIETQIEQNIEEEEPNGINIPELFDDITEEDVGYKYDDEEYESIYWKEFIEDMITYWRKETGSCFKAVKLLDDGMRHLIGYMIKDYRSSHYFPKHYPILCCDPVDWEYGYWEEYYKHLSWGTKEQLRQELKEAKEKRDLCACRCSYCRKYTLKRNTVSLPIKIHKENKPETETNILLCRKCEESVCSNNILRVKMCGKCLGLMPKDETVETDKIHTRTKKAATEALASVRRAQDKEWKKRCGFSSQMVKNCCFCSRIEEEKRQEKIQEEMKEKEREEERLREEKEEQLREQQRKDEEDELKKEGYTTFYYYCKLCLKEQSQQEAKSSTNKKCRNWYHYLNGCIVEREPGRHWPRIYDDYKSCKGEIVRYEGVRKASFEEVIEILHDDNVDKKTRKREREEEGRRKQGMNTFIYVCKSCFKENPKHRTWCKYCEIENSGRVQRYEDKETMSAETAMEHVVGKLKRDREIESKTRKKEEKEEELRKQGYTSFHYLCDVCLKENPKHRRKCIDVNCRKKVGRYSDKSVVPLTTDVVIEKLKSNKRKREEAEKDEENKNPPTV